MKARHLLQRLSPELDGRWVMALVLVGLLVAAISYVRWGGASPPLELVALGPDGTFVDTLDVPSEWADTTPSAPDAVARIPLILGVRNLGRQPATPERLFLSLPLRYRLATGGGQELEAQTEPASPLVRYTLHPALGPVAPGRLPELLPAYDTLWLEVVVPRFYCVALGDSIPELVPAPPPPAAALSRVRLFYAFEGGDMEGRRTGTLTVRFDSTLLELPAPEPMPSFPMIADAAAAQPDLGALAYVGSRRARCGEPEAPMELLSSVWETPGGGRFIALDYGGSVRKHLFDLDGDGVIERESWDPDGDGAFEATRRARFRTPSFLLPRSPSTSYPMARFDSIPPDSLARLDPFRRAMPGPGPVPLASGDTAVNPLFRPPGDTLRGVEARPEQPAAPAGPAGPLGRPVEPPDRPPPAP